MKRAFELRNSLLKFFNDCENWFWISNHTNQHIFHFSDTTENSFEFDKKATKTESLDHPDVAPGGSSNVSVSNALKGVEFIAQHIKNADKDTEVM